MRIYLVNQADGVWTILEDGALFESSRSKEDAVAVAHFFVSLARSMGRDAELRVQDGSGGPEAWGVGDVRGFVNRTPPTRAKARRGGSAGPDGASAGAARHDPDGRIARSREALKQSWALLASLS